MLFQMLAARAIKTLNGYSYSAVDSTASSQGADLDIAFAP